MKERAHLSEKLMSVAVIAFLAIGLLGIDLSEESECVSGVEFGGELMACNTNQGVRVYHEGGENVLIPKVEACNTHRLSFVDNKRVVSTHYAPYLVTFTTTDIFNGEKGIEVRGVPVRLEPEC